MMTGRARGFGVVEMPDSHAAHSAMDALNGTQSLAAPAALLNR
jgi:RNA recognition motif. (a.k.a. RRM, RBD, or RNP domain)